MNRFTKEVITRAIESYVAEWSESYKLTDDQPFFPERLTERIISALNTFEYEIRNKETDFTQELYRLQNRINEVRDVLRILLSEFATNHDSNIHRDFFQKLILALNSEKKIDHYKKTS